MATGTTPCAPLQVRTRHTRINQTNFYVLPKHLAATMDLWLSKLEEFGELDKERLTPEVRAQLLKASGATIDRLLKPTKDAGRPRGLSATKAGLLLRNSITVRKAEDEHEQAPGFIEADMVVHCGLTLAEEFVRTLTATDVFTGWTENVAVRNGAHKEVLEAMDEIVVRLPFPMVGLDTDYADLMIMPTSARTARLGGGSVLARSA